MFICPVPGVFQKFISGEITLFDPFLSKFLDHFCFRCDGGVIGTRHPTGIFPFHSGPTYENILNGVIEHMPHMQHTCDVGWGDQYSERLFFIGFGVKISLFFPVIIPFLLCGGMVILLWNVAVNFFGTHKIRIADYRSLVVESRR